jgi:hypothetical protein
MVASGSRPLPDRAGMCSPAGKVRAGSQVEGPGGGSTGTSGVSRTALFGGFVVCVISASWFVKQGGHMQPCRTSQSWDTDAGA